MKGQDWRVSEESSSTDLRTTNGRDRTEGLPRLSVVISLLCQDLTITRSRRLDDISNTFTSVIVIYHSCYLRVRNGLVDSSRDFIVHCMEREGSK